MSNNNEKSVKASTTTMNDDGDNNSSGGEQQPPNNPTPIITRFRSATDYEDESSLRDALHVDPPVIPNNNSMARLIGPCIIRDGNLSSICCDYHPHSMEDEVKRLMELKEYAILDSEQEEKFERITALASRIFNVPICLVSLVDIGRQWFMSNRGLGDVRETSREVSFCAHAIVSKEDVFIVPDTYEDPRFKENGLVTGPPFIRFYAGVSLVTPNGYKLGTFCIIDRTPRPMGLSLSEKQNLRELTEMVMDTMVHRKQEMEHLMDEKTRIIACAAHDLLSPITGIQLNMGLLMEDTTLKAKLDDNQKDLMDAAVKCSDMIERICVQAIESFRGDLTRINKCSSVLHEEDETSCEEKGLVKVDQLLDNVKRVVGAFPKKVPFFIEKNENVPQTIISDDLKLFRSILNYLTNACKHTQTGSIILKVYVRRAIDTATDMEIDLLPGALVQPKSDVIIVEVHDTGVGIDIEKYPSLFTPFPNKNDDNDADDDGSSEMNHGSQRNNSGLGLYSVATEINTLGGEYGVFPRQDLVASHPDHDPAHVHSENEASITGCVFWFSVPLVLPSNSPAPSPLGKTSNGDKTKNSECTEPKVVEPVKRKVAEVATSNDSNSPVTKKPAISHLVNKPDESTDQQDPSQRTKRVLVIDDSLTIRKGLSRGFSRLGFEVEEAENGLQGLKKLKSGLYDLVLLDFLMPVLDGPDVARKFRLWETEQRPDFHQYIVGVSAHANGKDAEVGIKAGMDRFMGKPVPLKSLKDLSQCKPVIEMSSLLDTMHRKSCDSLQALTEEFSEGSMGSKSSRSSKSSSNANSTFSKHSCLIVSKATDPSTPVIKRIADKVGWRVVISHGDGEDAIRLLKMRNWDAVFIDNELSILSGAICCVRFREWEKRSRSFHQKNMFLLSDTSSATPPTGFDDVLTKPIDPARVHQALTLAGGDTSFKFNRSSSIEVHRVASA